MSAFDLKLNKWEAQQLGEDLVREIDHVTSFTIMHNETGHYPVVDRPISMGISQAEAMEDIARMLDELNFRKGWMASLRRQKEQVG